MNENIKNMTIDDDTINGVAGGDTLNLDDAAPATKAKCKNCGNDDPNTFYQVCRDLEMITYHCDRCHCEFSFPRY